MLPLNYRFGRRKPFKTFFLNNTSLEFLPPTFKWRIDPIKWVPATTIWHNNIFNFPPRIMISFGGQRGRGLSDRSFDFRFPSIPEIGTIRVNCQMGSNANQVYQNPHRTKNLSQWLLCAIGDTAVSDGLTVKLPREHTMLSRRAQDTSVRVSREPSR